MRLALLAVLELQLSSYGVTPLSFALQMWRGSGKGGEKKGDDTGTPLHQTHAASLPTVHKRRSTRLKQQQNQAVVSHPHSVVQRGVASGVCSIDVNVADAVNGSTGAAISLCSTLAREEGNELRRTM